MGEHIDLAEPHHGGQAERGAHVVGEGEEAARVGQQAAMQGDAVEAGGHAVLADAEMDVAAGEAAGGDGLHGARLGRGWSGRGRPSRRPVRGSRRPGWPAPAGWPGGRQGWGGFRRTRPSGRPCPRASHPGSLPADDALELGAQRVVGEAFEPGAAGSAAAEPGGGPAVGELGRDGEWIVRPIERALGGVRRRPPRRERRGASPMTVRQAIRVGFLERSARESAAAICAGSWPSMRLVAQPCAAKRFSVSAEWARLVRPSSETPLSSQSTVSFSSRRWPARSAASWLTPCMRSPSEAMTQVRWSTRLRPKRAASMRSASAMPTALARP